MLKIRTWMFFLSLLAFVPAFSADKNDKQPQMFDLFGDGKNQPINPPFPFEYYKKNSGDKFDVIHQGGYNSTLAIFEFYQIKSTG